MTAEFKRALMEWKPISDRIIVARFRSKLRNTTVIQCYSPTEAADEADKDRFYEQLQATIVGTHRNDIKLILGDFNAKVGNDNNNINQIMGKEGLDGACNNNGSRLIDFCVSNQLFIGGTKFPHKNIHKYTWQSPDGVTRNQIDHILINKRFLSSLIDVRTMRSADIYSDHQLVVASITIKPKKVQSRQTSRRLKFNLERLKDDNTAEQFGNLVQDKIAETEGNVSEKWGRFQTSILEAATESIGLKDNTRKPWITDETWSHITRRRELKAQLNQRRTRNALTEYNRAEALVKKSAKRDHRRYNNNIIVEAETAAEQRNTRNVFQCIKKITGSFSNTPPIKDANGQILSTEQQQLERWMQHFERNNTEDVWTPCAESNNELQAPPSEEEVKTAIQKLKNNKASGIDNIPPELIKCNINMSSRYLTPIIQDIWRTGTIPDSWKEGLIIPIPKKGGDLRECKNWRPITLLNTITKVLAMIILDKISPTIYAKLRNEQAGFRPNRSCTDHVSSTRIIIEQSAEFQSPLYMAFVDFENAFPSVNRNAIWSALEEFDIPIKIINMIQELYRNADTRVLHKGKQSANFNINIGARQGCVLSPLMFLAVLDIVMRKTNTDSPNGIQWGLTQRLNDLDYADDLVLLAHKHADLQHKLNTLQHHGAAVGLKINIKKTKVMRMGTTTTTPVTVGNTPLEDVDEFVYLGCAVTKNGGTIADVSLRINKARQAFYKLNKIWNSSLMSRAHKLRLYNACVKSVLLYGCETWKVTADVVNKLQVFTNKCLRRIVRRFWPNGIRNTELLELTQQSPVATEILRRKWMWIGHTLRKETGDITKLALEWNPQGSRRRGRPALSWRRTVDKEARKIGKCWAELKAIAPDRARWRQIVIALCSS